MKNKLLVYSRFVAVFLVIAVLIVPTIVFAEKALEDGKCPPDMNTYDCEAIIGGWENYVPDDAQSTECGDSGESIPSGTPSQNGKSIFNFLSEPGRLKPYQAAGVIGNMVHESGLQPMRKQGTVSGVETKASKILESSPSTGWGLVQWTPATKFINEVGVSKADNLGTQIQFVWDQLEGKTKIPEKRAGNEIKSTTNIREAVLAFQGNLKVGGKYYGYERPADQSGSVTSRTNAAIDALARYGSGDSSENTVIVCGGGSNEVVGGYSLPVDQKWYESNPDWFTKPHHDYPSADIPVPTGTNVYSMTAGKVTKAPITTENRSYGQGVEIEATNGVVFIYAHGSDGGSISGVKPGDTVRPGQLIMHSASTGNSTGPHLHLEIRINGRSVCPQSLLKAIGSSMENIPTLSSLPSSGCTY